MSDLIYSAEQKIGFWLIDDFALMSYASAVEPLRAANFIAARPLYAMCTLSTSGQPVLSSCGLYVPCQNLDVAQTCHTIFVVAGGNPADWQLEPASLKVLRKLARLGVRLGGISGGAYVLAAAGLLNGRDFTIHWEYAAVLAEAMPHMQPRLARYVLDGDRLTCGGGVAALDMMHALIAQRLGEAFARRVSDWFLHTAIAQSSGPQRASAAERHGTRHPALQIALQTMETTLEHPLGRKAIALLCGVSERHLDRLFKTQTGRGFAETYRHLRLAHAKKLLEQSPLAISEIAFATGFSSASHFSRVFMQTFGVQPKSMR